MQVIRGHLHHAPQIAQLVDLYRQFYQCDADLDLAIRYITERITHAESTIFVAVDRDTLVGFVQLFTIERDVILGLEFDLVIHKA